MWLGLNSFSDEPVITHGLTLTSKIRFRDVVQVIRVRNESSLGFACYLFNVVMMYPYILGCMSMT